MLLLRLAVKYCNMFFCFYLDIFGISCHGSNQH